jgi:hypothetical protein
MAFANYGLPHYLAAIRDLLRSCRSSLTTPRSLVLAQALKLAKTDRPATLTSSRRDSDAALAARAVLGLVPLTPSERVALERIKAGGPGSARANRPS